MATELLREVNDKIQKLYEYQHVVESCEAILEKVENMNIVFADDTDMVDISRIITEDQMYTATNYVKIMLKSNKEDAESTLRQFLDFEPKEPEIKFGDGSDEQEEKEEFVAPDIEEIEPPKELVETETEQTEETETETEKKSKKKPGKKSKKKVFDDKQIEDIVKMKQDGYTYSQIGKKYNVTANRISLTLKEAGVYGNLDQGKIKALRDAGWSQKDIGEEFGVSQSAICKILKGMRE